LSCLDELGLTLALTRPHARAPSGERAQVTEPLHYGRNLSGISAWGPHGVCAPLLIEGAVNSEAFTLSVAQPLAPGLRPGTLALRDDVKFPYAPKASALREAAGARGEPLPASSPDFNPIEGCSAKLKAALRPFKARTQRTLSLALAQALALVTEADLRGWLEHWGYVSSLK
jgi:transposase